MTEKELAVEIIGSAFEVHRVLGPGLLGSVYGECLSHELERKKFQIERQYWIPLRYKERIVKESMLRLDLWVERKIIITVKSVDNVQAIHQQQVLTYLRQTGNRLGLLLNFNVRSMGEGVHKVIFG